MKQIIKRNKEIKIRLTEAEHQALLERMDGGELATWMRSVCLDEKPNKKRNFKVADPILLNALARIGGNLNQMIVFITVFVYIYNMCEAYLKKNDYFCAVFFDFSFVQSYSR